MSLKPRTSSDGLLVLASVADMTEHRLRNEHQAEQMGPVACDKMQGARQRRKWQWHTPGDGGGGEGGSGEGGKGEGGGGRGGSVLMQCVSKTVS